MPQTKKYHSHAHRQAAYRQRIAQARALELQAKGLPALPAVSTIPGLPRWNAALRQAAGLLETITAEMQQYYDDRSFAWQGGDRGSHFQERIQVMEELISSLDELTL